jgi:hypothetical protein
LPFNTSDYKDILIVLNGIFKTIMLISREDKINSITFTYSFERKSKKYIVYYLVISLIIIALFAILITFYFIPFLEYMFDTSNELKEVQNIPKRIGYETIDPITTAYNPLISIEYPCIKRDGVLNNFLNLFNKSSNQYFPSCFVPCNFTRPSSKNLLNIVLENQYYILDNSLSKYRSCLIDLSEIVEEYLSSL